MIKRLVTLSIAVVLTILALTFNKPSAANVGEMGEGVNAEITELKEFIKFADSLPDFLTMYEKGSKACGKNFASAKVISNGYQNSYHNIGHKETEY